MSLGPAEILVILVIALLVFGPKRLPEVGRQVGRTMSEFRRFQQVMRRDLDEVFHSDDVSDVSHAAEPPPTLPPKADTTSPPQAAGAIEPAVGDSPERPELGGPNG